ncbi:MAG: hypothetical protein ACXW1Q_04900, partial [Halobacteriota archaeon]
MEQLSPLHRDYQDLGQRTNPAYYTRQRKTLKGIAFFDVFVLLSRNPDVVRPTHDEKSGVYMCRVGV